MQEFNYEATIHNSPSLQPIKKFNYLRAELEEETLLSIEGLELTDTNYEAGIYILKEQLVLNTHYTQLIDMLQATNKTASLSAMYGGIEHYLKPLAEDINQRQFISIIRDKLSKIVTICLEPQKGTEKE